MSIFTLKHADKFGYFGTFDEAYKAGKDYLGAEIKEIKSDEIDNIDKMYFIGSSNDKFFTDVRDASLYTSESGFSMIPEIFIGMVNSKKIYGLAYMFFLRAMEGIDDIDKAFDMVKKRGDLYQSEKGVFDVPKKMNYLSDEITENYRLIYKMADSYAKIYDSFESTNDEEYCELYGIDMEKF
uniref:Uncharacterized protein n=1 Tax=Pithovirus LCPAC403 TaxID=2506596 RepID=A0A481ZCY8_9VIRU|nr:MAG: hypothetical protein LCPAC403_01340 [Pithovirus LCPAC403]